MAHGIISPPQSLLTEDQLAAMLSIGPQTLANWRCTKRYRLPFIKIGRCVRYRLADVEVWLRTRTITTPT